ncbi:CDP-2,3-bis-(O-geranylgeranyl)-sn-glycerol synthase [Candidatus Micrarchaeota archaeon]|nr:CDP-2,3-bis-(O-geranylgeranyl)-sn-glycerol synthase [Candidatus Micrarchaeota archaeon]
MEIVSVLLFLLPLYVANAIPVVLGGGAPIDFGIKFGDGRRLFGKGKTIRGFLSAISGGTLTAAIVCYFFIIPEIGDVQMQFLAGIIGSFGVMIGDVVGSFIKRRMNIEAGKPFFLDQVLFIVVAIIFAYPFAPALYTIENVAFMIVLSYLLHAGTNRIANLVGLKKVPW